MDKELLTHLSPATIPSAKKKNTAANGIRLIIITDKKNLGQLMA